MPAEPSRGGRAGLSQKALSPAGERVFASFLAKTDRDGLSYEALSQASVRLGQPAFLVT